jgi:hypothetical protein
MGIDLDSELLQSYYIIDGEQHVHKTFHKNNVQVGETGVMSETDHEAESRRLDSHFESTEAGERQEQHSDTILTLSILISRAGFRVEHR